MLSYKFGSYNLEMLEFRLRSLVKCNKLMVI